MIENRVNYKSLVLVSITCILLVIIMIMYNLNIIPLKERIKVLGDGSQINNSLIIPEKEDKITVGNEERDIRLKKYNSHFGYSIEYDIDNFDVVSLSDGSTQIKSKGEKSYIEISTLTAEDYYIDFDHHERNIYDKSSEEENHSYYYRFFHGNTLYLKLKICIYNEDELDDIIYRINYIVNTINVP